MYVIYLILAVVVSNLDTGCSDPAEKRSIIRGMMDGTWPKTTRGTWEIEQNGKWKPYESMNYAGRSYGQSYGQKTYDEGQRAVRNPVQGIRVHPWQKSDNRWASQAFTGKSKRNSFLDMLRTLQIQSAHRYRPFRFGAGLGRK